MVTPIEQRWPQYIDRQCREGCAIVEKTYLQQDQSVCIPNLVSRLDRCLSFL